MSDPFSLLDPELLDSEITVGEYFEHVKIAGAMTDKALIRRVEDVVCALPIKSMAFIALNELLNRYRRKK